MYLDYSKLEFDADGHIDPPELMLQTLNGEDIGTIAGVHNLSFNIKFVEQSVMEFDVPRTLDGRENLLYEQITGYKLIHTLHYGDYVTMNPKKSSDGIAETKHVTAYSIEKLLEKRKFFLEEGVYKLCNVANIDDPGTIIGRIREIDPTWNIGDIDPLDLAGKYAVFDSYDGELYDFMMNNVMQKYRCVFVFDPYGTPGKPGKTINIYSADQTRKNLGIYLDFDNLLTETDVEEVSDEMITAIRPYGADELSILDVNPTGDNWVYDLSGFIARGDLGDPNDASSLAAKFIVWQHRVLINRPKYRALTAARASAWQRYYTETANLNELQGQLDSLLVQQNVAIQGNDPTLPTITARVTDKTAEVNAQKVVVEKIYKDGDATCDIGRLNSEIATLVNGTSGADALAIRRAFTDSEYQQLLPFILQQDVTDDTFYASEISADMTPASIVNVNGRTLTISGAHIESSTITSGYPCTIYTISDGTLSGSFVVQGEGNTTQEKQLTANIVRGTLEMLGNMRFTLSLYTGTVSVGDKSAEDGLLTVSGTYLTSGCSTNVAPVTDANGVTINVGNSVVVATNEAKLYLTASAGEFQKWAVEQQLYDYAVGILADVAQPTYQFTVESGNFLFAREFAPFRNELELGCGVYLNLPGEQTITPYLIELSVNFETPDEFSLLFSNRFKRKDNVNTLKDIIEKSYSAGRSFDLSKHGYRTAEDDATDAAKFIRSSLDFAKNRIQSASNQSVVIDGAGIQIRGQENDVAHRNNEMRIVNDMIAITDDKWQSSKLAIGYFQDASGANYFGVNAGVIAGSLIVGTELNIGTSAGHFRVDNSGVYIDSMKFYITHSSGGNTTLGDDLASLQSSTESLQTSVGNLQSSVGSLNTTISGFYNNGYLDSTKLSGVINAQRAQMKSSSGNVLFDRDGIWLMNGTSKQTTTKAVWMNENGVLFGSGTACADPGGDSSGWTWTTAINHDGITADAINGKYISGLHLYGGELYIGPKTYNQDGSVATWNFSVDPGGNLTANSGTFKGTLDAAKIKGKIVPDGSGWLIGCGLKIGGVIVNNDIAYPNFMVDTSGNVTMSGNITLGGTITWSSNSQISSDKVSGLSNVAKTGSYGDLTGRPTILTASDVNTYIDNKLVASPNIVGGRFYGYANNGFNASTQGYMQIDGSQYVGLYLRYANGANAFSIYDPDGQNYAKQFKVEEQSFLQFNKATYGRSGSLTDVYPQGHWWFGNASSGHKSERYVFGETNLPTYLSQDPFIVGEVCFVI